MEREREEEEEKTTPRLYTVHCICMDLSIRVYIYHGYVVRVHRGILFRHRADPMNGWFAYNHRTSHIAKKRQHTPNTAHTSSYF